MKVMSFFKTAWILGAAATLCAASLASATISNEDLAKERQGVEQWKARRVASLTSETGWLTLNGLFWLKPGKNTFGRSKSNALVLDNKSLAERAGAFVVEGHKVSFVA